MEISEMPIWEPQTSSIPCERGLAKGVKNMQIQGDSDTCPKTNMDTQNVGFGNVSPASKMASFWVSMIKKCWGCMFFWWFHFFRFTKLSEDLLNWWYIVEEISG